MCEIAADVVREASAVVKPWYRQFYLRRGEAEWASDRVSDDGYQRGLEAIEGFVYVGTAMYGNPMSVRVAVHDAEPEPTSDEADRVVEVSVSGDGPLAIFSWASDEAEATVELPAGSCRLRASWFDVGAAETHPDADLSGEEISPERVLFELWPLPEAPTRVLRSRPAF